MRQNLQPLALALLSALMLCTAGCGCGFDCNNGNDREVPAILSLGFSDAIPEELKQVVIEVERITFRRDGTEDVVIEQFTIDDLDAVAAESFQIDLLQYRGRNQLLVITDLELDQGNYSSILLDIADDDINSSFVQEADDSLKPLVTGASGLQVPGMSLPSGEQLFTVEFSLAQSLQERSGDASYLLTSDGIRTEDNAVAASLSGRVDSSLFDSVTPCDEKTEPESGNRIYLYQGTGLAANQPGDVFNDGSGTTVPDDVEAPFAVAALVEDTLTGGWRYALGYLPAGDYTLAFSCDAEGDDPVDFDDLVIPLPSNQVYELRLTEGEQAVCDLTENADCGGS